MPDVDGYEIPPQFRPRETVLHFPCDQRVPNTPKAKREHLKACTRAQQLAARAEQRQREREAAANLRQITRLRKESERAYERAAPAFTPGAHQMTIDPEGDPTA